MDFGTMRAKLHEGLYTSLEQFEHDVFLISGNAMHFNSSGTIFFRQAHGIDKLAKRVFHVLRTNPENFESEFSGSRRRSCRRSQDEIHEFNNNFFSKEKSSTATVDASLKNTNSLIHTSFLENPRIATGGDGKRCDPIEVDRRSTYKPDLNLNNDTWSKSLIYLNQHDHSYSQSLMQFVKDLGPTAQMVAKRKLQNITVNPQPTMRELGKQPQLPTGQMWFNSSRSISTMKPMNRDNVFERDESSRHSMVMSCSSGRMDSVITSASSLPAWLRQEPCASRFAVVSGSLRSNFGRINEGRECEEGSCSYNKPFDPRDLTLQL
ncbi:putative chromatin remodeler Bromodomain family [Helianthus annuus]|nr:putative chromatin remodeler Bromodomain family [Helianthus annuus]